MTVKVKKNKSQNKLKTTLDNLKHLLEGKRKKNVLILLIRTTNPITNPKQRKEIGKKQSLGIQMMKIRKK